MSATAVCPACGHVNAGDQVRPGALVRCSNCTQSFLAKRSGPTMSSGPALTPLAPPPQSSNPQSFAAPSFSAPSPFAPDLKPAAGGTAAAANDAEPSGLVAFAFMFALVGVMILICGGFGAYFARTGNENQVAELEPVEVKEVPEFKRPEPPPRQPVIAPPRRAIPEFTPPPVPPPMPVTPPSFTPPPPPISPPGIPQPPAIPRPIDPPGSPLTPPSFRPTPVPPAPFPMGPLTDDQRLDEVLKQLKDPTMRSKFFSLNELERIPLQENRRAEVAAAIDPYLNSTDIGAAMGAYKAAAIWGTEANVPSLTAALDSREPIIRWHAIRLLPELSPTAETADKLAAILSESSNSGPLREAFKLLGATGETALLKQLETGDPRTKQAALSILNDVATEASRPALQKMAETETDFSLKSRAGRALKKIDERGKK